MLDVIQLIIYRARARIQTPAIIELIKKPQPTMQGIELKEEQMKGNVHTELEEQTDYSTDNIAASTFNGSALGFILRAGLIVSKAMKHSTGTLVPHTLMDSSLRQLFTRTRRPFSVT